MRDDTRRKLEEAGRRPVPEPRPGFEEALEARLMAVELRPSRIPATGSPWRRPAFRLAAGFASIVLVFGIVVVGGGDDRPALAFELTGSVNVEVALADGTTLTDPDGILLPEGAIVRVGAHGSARVGDVELHEGDIATLVDGRLRIDRQPSGVAQTDGTPTGTTSTVRPSTPPPTPSASASVASPSTTTPRPSEAQTTARPTPTGPTSISPAPTKDQPPKSATPTPAEPSARPADAIRIKLEAWVVGENGIRATWTAVPEARRYVLIATKSKVSPARDPVYPGSGVIGVFTIPPDKPLAFRVSAGVIEIRLQVVALDAAGNVLGRSRSATVSMPG